ncbi:uncharacterized protein KY384_002802 [Bacidia gigantensis]|uniref:uncharacterized protein n=1 Tax=Bacidia gigantensis TaxID=2732470 RepID=UPI001D044366|nr:uncharacterized protein KY384_002802 [Bacidia gigantensis]KAG8532924.1 hypothetical protein KY384_002802 [Bacidia gigantensis]
MAQENKYPSPEPASSSHPYPNNQHSLAQDGEQQTQPAPTAMMSESRGDETHVPPGFYAVAQYTVPQAPSTPQALAQQTLDANGTSTDKKNKKVSRACDECRRKKVRKLEKKVVAITHIIGPLYIKELAERVNRLETGTPGQPDTPYGAVNHGFPNPEPQAYSPHLDFSTPVQRKRTHSMAEGTSRYSEGPEQLHTYARGYFTHIHSSLPILPENGAELTSTLNATSPELRSAFAAALTTAVRGTSTLVGDLEIKGAADLYLALPEKGHGSSTASYSLIRLQTLIFLAIAEEYAGPGPSRTGKWLGAAVTLAKSLPIRRRKQQEMTSRSELGNLLRRSWFSLVVLDRWHAAAICGSPNIPDADVQLEQSDHTLLGSSSYHVLLMRGEVARLDESISPLFESLPLIHLAHLHLRMLSDKAVESMSASGEQASIEAAIAAITLLSGKALSQVSPSPLEHHILALATAVLAHALPSHGKPVKDTLADLRSWCENGQAHVAPGWREMIVGAINHVLAKGGLPAREQGAGGRDGLLGLADAAVPGNGSGTKGEWSVVMEGGYSSLFE